MKKGLLKPWKLLKICAILVMLIWLASFPAAAHVNSQLLDRKVTFTVKEVSLETALHKLQAASGVKIFFSIEHIERSSPEAVTLSAKDETLGEILNKLLGPYNIRYRVDEKNIAIIILREESVRAMETHSRTQDSATLTRVIDITGRVVDAATRQPMPGVSIVVKGTANGVITDANGNYTLRAEEGDVLVFSFISYRSFETTVGTQTTIDVSLEGEAKALDEVVINAGYYNVSDRERTGNISKVGAKDIQKQPVQNALSALQGRVPGLEITQRSGVPGGNFTVRIRGTNSIANGNDPLYIIDGVPFTSGRISLPESGSVQGPGGANPLNAINPADIESIEVLKDADATAIYGSRGSNGVILITTKKGKPGKMKVDFSFYTGVGKVTRMMDLLNTRDYLQMRREAFANDNVTPTTANARDLLVWDTTRYTNWQKKLIGGTARTSDVQLSFSGGDTNTQFVIGTGYHKETTVFPGDNSDQRLAFHSNVTSTSHNKKFRVSLLVNYTLNSSDLIWQDLTDRALLLPPVAPNLLDENGDLDWTNWSATYENPLAYTRRMYEAKTNNIIGNTTLSYVILSNLEIKTSFGYTNIDRKAITTNPISSQFPDPASYNSTDFVNTNFRNWIIEPQLNWKPKLGQGTFDVLVGSTFFDQTNEGLAQGGYGYSSEALMKNLSVAPNRTIGTNYYSQYRYNAVFGRINYSWRGKYIANLTGRRDGSSRFGPGKQFANFGAVGAAWIFSEETFMKNSLSFLSFGKLRGSYGVTGNDQLGDYQYLDSYSSSGAYQNGIGLQPDRLSNPDFAWETNKKIEGGIELGFLRDRIFTSISYYRNQSSNQLVGFPLPATTGFSSIQGNFPATVQNTGVEVLINTRNIETPVVSWSTSLNLSVPKNKLVSFPNLEAFPAYATMYLVGEPLSIRRVYNYTGIDPETGLYTFEDVNNDGQYNFEDAKVARFVGQKFFGGISNSFQFKGFQLDVLFQFVKQTANNYTLQFGSPGEMVNAPAFVTDRWQDEGDNTNIQRYSRSGEGLNAYYRYVTSDQSVSDASYIRLKNLSLSYSVSQVWLNKLHITQTRLFVQAQNLLTFTKYKGLDPETTAAVQLPPLRVITVGLNLSL